MMADDCSIKIPSSASQEDVDIWSRILSKRRKEWLKFSEEDFQNMDLDSLMKKGIHLPPSYSAKLKPNEKLERLLQNHFYRSLDLNEKPSRRRYSWNLVQTMLTKIDEIAKDYSSSSSSSPATGTKTTTHTINLGAVDSSNGTQAVDAFFRPINKNDSSKENASQKLKNGVCGSKTTNETTTRGRNVGPADNEQKGKPTTILRPTPIPSQQQQQHQVPRTASNNNDYITDPNHAVDSSLTGRRVSLTETQQVATNRNNQSGNSSNSADGKHQQKEKKTTDLRTTTLPLPPIQYQKQQQHQFPRAPSNNNDPITASTNAVDSSIAGPRVSLAETQVVANRKSHSGNSSNSADGKHQQKGKKTTDSKTTTLALASPIVTPTINDKPSKQNDNSNNQNNANINSTNRINVGATNNKAAFVPSAVSIRGRRGKTLAKLREVAKANDKPSKQSDNSNNHDNGNTNGSNLVNVGATNNKAAFIPNVISKQGKNLTKLHEAAKTNDKPSKRHNNSNNQNGKTNGNKQVNMGATNETAAFVPIVTSNGCKNLTKLREAVKGSSSSPCAEKSSKRLSISNNQNSGTTNVNAETPQRTNKEVPTIIRPIVKIPAPPKHIKFQQDNRNFTCSQDKRSEVRLRYHRNYLSQTFESESNRKIHQRLSEWDPFWTIHYGFFDRTSKVEKVELLTFGDAPQNIIEFDFTLPPKYSALTTTWGSISGKAKDGEARFLIRMLPLSNPMLNSKKPVKRADTHIWPIGTFLQINDSPVQIHQRKQQSHDKKKWQGMCQSLDVTAHISQPTKRNKIQICCLGDEPYIACLAMCCYQSPYPSVYQTIKNNYLRKMSHSDSVKKALSYVNKEMVVLDDDDDKDGDINKIRKIENSSITFSLFCPLSRTLMKTPVRGVTCKHWQCFDLQNFLQSNEAVSGQRWRCVLCENFVSPEQLEECGLHLTLLDQYRMQATLHRDRVQFRSDSTWDLMDESKKRYQSSGQKRSAMPSSKRSKFNSPNSKKKTFPQDNEVVILD